MPSDVRHSRADLRSTLEVDRLTAIRAPLNLTPTTPRTAELRPKIANASHLQHLDPMQACKILYALSSRVVNCRNPNCHCGVLQLAPSDTNSRVETSNSRSTTASEPPRDRCAIARL